MRDRKTFAIVGALALLSLVLHIAVDMRDGYFRDELYYLVCGDNPAWGYADHPPLIGWIAWLTRHTVGDSVVAIRLLPALAGAATIFLAAALAAAFGGGRPARVLAALAVAVAPYYVASAGFLSMNVFEPLFWGTVALLVARIIDSETGRSTRWMWLAAGATAGFGLLDKHSMAFFAGALALGLLLTPERRILADRWAWAAAGLGLLIVFPHVLWEVREGWPIFEILHNAAQGKNYEMSPLEFIGAQAMLMHPFAAPLALAGLGWLLVAPGGRRFRALGIACVGVLALLIALAGKAYYAAPLYPIVLAAGAVAAERLAERTRRAWLLPAYGAIVAVGGIIALPMTVPMLSTDAFVAYASALGVSEVKTENHRMGRLPQFYADREGWPEMAGEVARAYHALPEADRARCAIFTGNYGEAGAIDLYGRSLGLPRPISGHQNYYLWGPRGATGEVLLTVGEDEDGLRKVFRSVEEVGRIRCGDCMPYEDDGPVYLCREPIAPLAAIWPRTKHWE